MSQILIIILVILAVFFVPKLIRRQMRQVDDTLNKVREDEVKKTPADTLEKDPETGVYRPKDRDGEA